MKNKSSKSKTLKAEAKKAKAKSRRKMAESYSRVSKFPVIGILASANFQSLEDFGTTDFRTAPEGLP